jgi:Zn-dependent M28 family amino/carboxypeptidase
VDSARTPISFRSSRWTAFYQVFVAVIFVLAVVQIVLYLLGTVTQWRWIWPASLPYVLCSLLLVAHNLHADRTPFGPGANDNATGAGLVLTLAQHLQAEPLRHTRVWLVNTGCEEVQHYGAADFFRRHRRDLYAPLAVAFEMLGCSDPAWLTREGIVVPFDASPGLVALAESLAAEHPEWRARAVQVNGGNTEMADALLAGVPAITLGGTPRNGQPTYYHQPEDTYDKMDPDVMARSYAFVWAFIRALDVQAGG